jgi:hypothetical protein
MSIVDRHQRSREAVMGILGTPSSTSDAVLAARTLLEESIVETNQELRRCADWIDRGLMVEAVAHAKASHDLVQRGAELQALASRPDWIAACESSGTLPSSPIDAAALSKLNASFAKVRGFQEPLREMRRAFLGRHSPIAQIEAVQRLADADPRSEHWRRLAESLEDEAMATIVAQSEESLASRRLPGVEDALRQVDSRRWTAAMPQGLRQRLDSMRTELRQEQAEEAFSRIADAVHEAAAAMDRPAMESLAAEWTSLVDGGFRPSAQTLALVAPSFDWLDSLRDAEREEARRASLRSDLERALDERRDADSIERLASSVIEAEGEIPPGLAGRVEAVREREASRRRRRLLFTVSWSTATVLAVATGIGFLGVFLRDRSLAKSTEAQIRSLLDSGSVIEAAQIARSIQSSRPEFVLAHPDLAAAAEEALQAESIELARGRRVADTIASSEALLNDEELSLLEIEGELDRLKRIARESDRSEARRVEALQAQWTDRREDRLLEEITLARLAIAELAGRLEDLPFPRSREDSRRSPEMIAKLAELENLIAEESVRFGHLDGQQDGFLALQVDIGKLREAWTEHADRSSALAAALASISDPQSPETEHLAAYRSLLRDHGAVLQAEGTLGDHELGERSAKAAVAIANWRDVVWPAATVTFQTGDDWYPRDFESAGRLATLLEEHLATHPFSPYRQAGEALLEESRLVAAIDSGRDSLFEEVEARLKDSGLSSLWFVRTSAGPRYGRGLENGRMKGEVRSTADLTVPLGKLSSPILNPAEVLGAPEPTNSTVLLEEFLARLPAVPPSGLEAALLDLFSRASSTRFDDPGLQLQMLRVVASTISNLHPSSEAGVAMRKWLDQLPLKHPESLRYDWLVVAQGQSDRNRTDARRAFLLALGSVPDAAALARESRQRRAESASRLAAVAPGGILVPPDARGVRRVEGRASGRSEFWVVVFDPGSDRCRIEQASVIDGSVILPRPLPPPVPVQVFIR